MYSILDSATYYAARMCGVSVLKNTLQDFNMVKIESGPQTEIDVFGSESYSGARI